MYNHYVRAVEDFVIVNDAVRKAIFGGEINLPATFKKILTVKDTCNGGRNKKKVSYAVTVTNTANFPVALTLFDAAVYDAVISEWLAGNKVTTPARIWRILGGGNVNNSSLAMERAIWHSLDKLGALLIEFSPCKALQETYGFDRHYCGVILSWYETEATINARQAATIFIKGSILFDIADTKDHVKRVPRNFFDLDIRHTERVIVLLHYLIRRAAEIVGTNQAADNGKKCRRLRNVILLATLCRDCGFEVANRDQYYKLRKEISAILDALKRRKFISGWEFETETAASVDDEGNEIPAKGNPKIRAIKLTFPRRQPIQPTPIFEQTL